MFDLKPFFLLLFIAVSGAQTPKGDRLLGISITDAERADYPYAVELIRSAGAQVTSLSFGWDDIETAPGQFDSSLIDIIDQFYPVIGMPVNLTLTPIDTNNSRVPSDLQGRAWDDPELISRFKTMLDFFFSRVQQTQIPVMVIGNEIDLFLPDDASWQQFRNFVVETGTHAKSLRSGMIVGSTITLDGLTQDKVLLSAQHNEITDAVLTTYYPLDDGFQVKPPATVFEDIDRLLSLYPDQAVYFMEAGYPSGVGNGSSELDQQTFVRDLFLAWDQHRDRIPMLVFEWLNDVDSQALDFFADYYRIDDPGFTSYLGTLGLRTNTRDGEDKPAFRQLKKEAAARGWSTAYVINSSAAGSWFDPTLNGTGFAIDSIQNDQLAVYWYTFTPEGERLWLVGLGLIRGNRVEVDFVEAQGGVFGSQLDPAQINRSPWGRGQFEFNDCQTAQFSYQAEDASYGNGSLDLQRLAPAGRDLETSCF